jgi:Glycosyltransferase family 87
VFFLSIAIFVAVGALLILRIWHELVVPGEPGLSKYALQDFRDAIYYPTVAWLEGVNPYDSATYLEAYPAGQVFPPYGPALFLIHLPFAFLSLRTAALLYAALSFVLTGFLAALSLRVAGQCTLPLVLAIGAVLASRRRSDLVAGVGLALTSIKPTFAVPLGVLLIAQGRWRVIATGGALAGVASILSMAPLVWRAGGVTQFLDSVFGSYATWGQSFPNALPTAIFRVDLLNLLAKVQGASSAPLLSGALSVTVMALGGWMVYRLRRVDEDPLGRDISFTIASLTILVCIYHQVYDVLLLVPPIMLWARRLWQGPADPIAYIVFLAMMVPMVNYGASWDVLGRFALDGWHAQVLVSLNSLALMVAFLGSLVMALRLRATAEVGSPSKLAGGLEVVV